MKIKITNPKRVEEDSKESVRINITIPKDVREKAKNRADELGLSMSALVRMLIVKEVNEQ